ncbi:MAG TPA: guanylate cyclase [Bacteroidota bacterium]|nr:guanylate cyclase [Bacteroidota bacterium]
MKTSATIVSLKLLAASTRVLHGITIGIVILYVLPFIAGMADDAGSYSYVRVSLEAERIMSLEVKKVFPTQYGGKDLTRFIVIGAALLFGGILSRTGDRLQVKAQFFTYKNNFEEWKARMNLSENSIILSPLNRTLDELKNARRKDRDRLLREYAQAKKQLDAMGRDLAFLAVDIVDSTGMKQGEEQAIIEHDFREYKKFVGRIFTANGCLKSAWTPDGVMSCFTSVDAAVRAAREIITGLERFNREVKSVKRDFVVRCGVNSGFVYYDDSVPLEEISDRVIDVAGHMQKHARPNSVCVAKPAIEPLNDREGFEASGRVVDGYEVYEWADSVGTTRR